MTVRLRSWEGPEGTWVMGRAAQGMGAWEGQRLMEDPSCGAWLCRPFAGAQPPTVEPGAGQPWCQWAKAGPATLRHRRSLSLSGPGLAPRSSARAAPMAKAQTSLLAQTLTSLLARCIQTLSGRSTPSPTPQPSLEEHREQWADEWASGQSPGSRLPC